MKCRSQWPGWGHPARSAALSPAPGVSLLCSPPQSAVSRPHPESPPEGEGTTGGAHSIPSPRGVSKQPAHATEPGMSGQVPPPPPGGPRGTCPTQGQRRGGTAGGGQRALPCQAVVQVICVSGRRYASGTKRLGRPPLSPDLPSFLQNYSEPILFSGEQNMPKSNPKPLCMADLTASSKFSKLPSMVRCHSYRDEVSPSFPSLCSLGMQRAISSLARSLL